MNKKIIISLLAIISLFIAIPTPVYANFDFKNTVRDMEGNRVSQDHRYLIHIYRPDGTGDFYVTHNNISLSYLSITDDRSKADQYYFTGDRNTYDPGENTANGKCNYRWIASSNLDQVNYFDNDMFIVGGYADIARFGFLRITGDRDYKYFLLVDRGTITINFNENKFKSYSGDNFILSFELVE